MAPHAQGFEGERKEKVRKEKGRKGGTRKSKARGVFASRNKAMKRIIEPLILGLKNVNTFILLYKLL